VNKPRLPKKPRDSENPSFEWLKKSWSGLSQAAIWIISIIGGFLLPPPVGISDEADKVWLRLAQFTITVVLGIMFIAARRWKKQKHATRWWIASAVLLIASLATFVGYQTLSYKWTCQYYNELKIVGGDQHTQHGADYIREHPGVSCETLLKEHAGNVYDVWTKESIDRRRIALAVIYISCAPFFTVCIIAVTQAIYIIGNPR
jgi:hypothetical protein